MTINFVPTIISAVILVSHSPYAPLPRISG